MRNFSIKRMNRKGFTLIELLAIIVILAIILVIAIPEILDTMDSSRVSSLHSSAKGVANWWEQQIVADTLVTTAEQKIGSANGTLSDGDWHCLDDLTFNSKTMFDVAGLNEEDVQRGVSAPGASGATIVYGAVNAVGTTTCSAIRNNGGTIEVILFATNTGKFNTANGTYAASAATGGATGTTLTY